MKIWKIIVMLALPYFIIGCCQYNKPIEIPYSICTLDIENIDFKGKEIILSQADTLLKQAYGIQLRLGIKDDEFCKSSTSIFPSAHASSCDYEDKFRHYPNQNIRKIDIITLNNFDSTHQAGDTITAYFYEYDGESYNPLDQKGSIIKEHLTIQSIQPVQLDFLLMVPPSQSGQQSFRVEIELMDNRKLTTTSKSIYLL